ncbi:MAG TPA: flagellar biosynthetic protein FliR [Gallionellaceae bacterium]|nr:flagellar biosynthetic protein FliR [Gallionellaceae bacterium]
MISVTSAQLSAWIAAFFFPFVRILALVASAPILGNAQIPVRIKVGLAVMLTMIIAPTVDIPPGVEVSSAIGLLVLVQQILVGAAMGFVMRLIFTAVELAGDIAGMQMGLGFATFYDPINASHNQVLSQFLGILAALLFLSLNGHLFMLQGLAESFHSFPVSTQPPNAAALFDVAGWGGSIFTFGLQLSLPLVAALLLTNLALGILTRSAPQLNIFSIGFPITLAIGFIMLMLIMPYLGPLMDAFARAGNETMLRFVQHSGKTP